MSIDTTKLRELAQKATPGPWHYELEHGSYMRIYSTADTDIVTGCGCCGSPNCEDADAKFISAANPATVLALLDEIKNSRAVLKSYSKVLVEISESLDIAPFHFTTPVAVERCKRLIAIEKAARNLAKVKGRHHSEQAMNQLLEALK